MPANPPPPEPITYAAAVSARPWSRWPVTFACAGLTFLAFFLMAALDGEMRRSFRSYKVALPAATTFALALSRDVVRDGIAPLLLLAAFAVPFFVVPLVPTPATDASRRRVRRTVLIAFAFAVLTLLAGFAAVAVCPLVAPSTAVAGPAKH